MQSALPEQLGETRKAFGVSLAALAAAHEGQRVPREQQALLRTVAILTMPREHRAVVERSPRPSPDPEPRPRRQSPGRSPDPSPSLSPSSHSNQAVIDRHIDRIFLSRVGIRFLVKHYVASREPVGGRMHAACAPHAHRMCTTCTPRVHVHRTHTACACTCHACTRWMVSWGSSRRSAARPSCVKPPPPRSPPSAASDLARRRRSRCTRMTARRR